MDSANYTIGIPDVKHSSYDQYLYFYTMMICLTSLKLTYPFKL